jgi:uncharacterized phage infection (PIP) family protein YhgE
MADSDQSLKILIELGVIGEKDAEAAKQLIEENAKAVGDLSQSLPEGTAAWSKYKNLLNETSKEGEGFNMHGREMKKLLNELNELVPGSANAVKGLTEVLTGAGGGFAVVELAIAAAKTYWELYREEVRAVAEAQAKAMDKIRSTTEDARRTIEDFATARDKAMHPEDEIGDKLSGDLEVIAAQFRAKKNLLQAEQDAATANAKTPEEKDAVAKKFKGQMTELESQEQAARLQRQQQAQDDYTAKVKQLTEDRAKAEQDLLDAVHEQGVDRKLGVDSTAADAAVAGLTEKLKKLGDELIATQQRLTAKTGEVNTAQRVFAVDEKGRSAVENPVVGRAFASGALDLRPGEQANNEQREANTALAQAFAQYTGGIATLQAIVRSHLAHSTSASQEMEVLKTALANLQAQVKTQINQ